MAERDKIRELAEKICNVRPVYYEDAGRILRAELKPLLDAATKALARGNWDGLAAELQGWRKE